MMLYVCNGCTVTRSRQQVDLRRRGTAGPLRHRWAMALLAAVLALVAPVAPATALTHAGHQSALSPGFLAPPAESVAFVVPATAGDTADQIPSGPVPFRSKKATTAVTMPVVPPPDTFSDPILAPCARPTLTDVPALTGFRPACPDARGPPRQSMS
jgi:hypothetical protein